MGNIQPTIETRVVTYQSEGQEVKLSPQIIRNYLVVGNGHITDQEIVAFLQLCRYQGLNPFLRDAYLIKYGSQPASIVTGKEFFMKRARSAKDLEGYRAGVIVGNDAGEIKDTLGIVPPGWELVGGWAEVYVEGWKFPVRIEVQLKEYLGRKSDGTVNRQWSEKPATMIRKVAMVQALREAFPRIYGGLYSPEEINTVDQSTLPETPVSDDVIDVEATNKGNGGQQPTAAKASGDNGGNGDSLTVRRRRNAVEVEGEEVKTAGISGELLQTIRNIEANHPELGKVIDDYLGGIGVQDITFLRDDEGKELINILASSMQKVAKAPQPEPQKEQSPPTDDASGSVPCPNRGGTQISKTFCQMHCENISKCSSWKPGNNDKKDNLFNGNGNGDTIHCPVKNSRIYVKVCDAKCNKQNWCDPYQEYLHSKEG